VIASLRGTLLEAGAGTCVIEAAGVGYLVSVSSHTARALPESGREVLLRTRQVVREDALMLFGFIDPEELRLFDLMIGVSGVGPKLALAVLSGMKPQALARAIREEHIGALVAIPGVGRKTAERLIVELRDKLEGVPGTASRATEAGVLPRSERFEDAVAALVRLGYNVTQAREVMRTVGAGAGDGAGELTLEDLVRRALALLSKPAVAR
jgi:Holliday junction DNA helicase RuvA